MYRCARTDPLRVRGDRTRRRPDPTLLTTTAVRDGDEWVINGHKWFTSNGSVADILLVMAVTNPDVHPYQGVR